MEGYIVVAAWQTMAVGQWMEIQAYGDWEN